MEMLLGFVAFWHIQILMYRWFAEAQWQWADSAAH